MSAKSRPPVIFLAFADPRQDLRDLHGEEEDLKALLAVAKEREWCRPIFQRAATAEDIFRVFQDQRGQIAIFHFGGHANGYQTILESFNTRPESLGATGFAAFLASQQNLKLAFLNACSTEPQAQHLLNAGVSSVIATSREIEDAVAREFATVFYRGLTTGASIQSAFEEATGACEAEAGCEPGRLYKHRATSGWTGSDPDDGTACRTEERWPWALYPSTLPAGIAQWNLASAARDPLADLPLPKDLDAPAEPFVHLRSFRRADAPIFFGRGYEVRALYNLIDGKGNAPIILVHGQTGVGKSSFLAAGLLPRLEARYAIRMDQRRREGGLSVSLWAMLDHEAGEVSAREVWRAQEASTATPLLVVIDQAEEAYTQQGAKSADAEVGQFIEVLKNIFSTPAERPAGKLIVSFRKEWLAEFARCLDEANLPYESLPLERLRHQGIMQAIRGPAGISRYQLELDDEDLPRIIADDLHEDPESPLAPTLEILLTRMWERVKTRAPRRFDTELYRTLKSKGYLLKNFLDQALIRLEDVDPEAAGSGLALDLLSFHTTGLGTARQRTAQELAREYPHELERVRQLIKYCYELRLLVEVGDCAGSETDSRLVHDSLAPLVGRRFKESDLPGQRARRVLESRALEWNDRRHGATLDDADLATVEGAESGMRAWTEDEHRLVHASMLERNRKRRTRRVLQGGLGTSVIAVIAFGIVAWWQQVEVAENLALNEWSNGIQFRDHLDQPTRAAHWFARAVDSPDHDLADSARLAATDLIRGVNLMQVLAHPEDVRGAVFNSDETRILSWSGDGTVRLWDTETGNEILPEPLRHTGQVWGAALNATETRILSWGNGEIRLWNAHTGKEVLPERFYRGGPVWGAVFNADETHILGWGDDGVHLWDVHTGKEVLPEPLYGGAVLGAVFNTDQTRIVGWWDEGIQLWDVQTGKEVLREPLRHDSELGGLVFNADKTRILSWGTDGTILLWDAQTGRELLPEPLRHDGRVAGAVLNAQRRILTWGDEDIWLWDAQTGKGMLREPLRHDDDVMGAVFNRDGTRILSWDNNEIRLWDAQTGKEALPERFRHDGFVVGAVFNADGSRILSWGADGIRLWDAQTGKEVLPQPLRHGVRAGGAVFSADEKRILSWGADGTIRLWEMRGDREVSPEPRRHDDDLEGAVFNANGTHILSWATDAICLWDAQTGKEVLPKQLRHDGSVGGAVFGTDENRILSWGADGIRLWDAKTGKPVLSEPLRHDGRLGGAALNANGTRILSWGTAETRILSSNTVGTVLLWDAQTGEQVLPQPLRHPSSVWGAAFNADGTRILSWGIDEIRLWDAQTGKEVLSEPLAGRNAVFSADGMRILSWDTGEIRLWDAQTGKEVLSEPIRHSRALGAAFNTDGTRILSWGSGEIRLWDMKSGQQVTATLRHGGVQGATLNADETRILSWDADGTIRLWDVQTSRDVILPLRHVGLVGGAVLSADEMRILSRGRRSVRLWDVSYESVTSEVLSLQVQARTGTFLTDAGDIRILGVDEWRTVKDEYARLRRESENKLNSQ